MIRLINNEFIKIKKVKVIFTYICYIITLIILNKYSDKNILDLSYYLIPVIGVIVSILYGGIISSEKENGSFRYYLTKPYKRWKIYIAKLLCIIIYITISLFIIIITSCLLYHVDKSYIIKFITYSTPVYFIGFYILYLSTIFKSQTFISGLSIITLTFSLIFAEVLFGIRFNIIEYTFLPYLDFSLFNDKVLLNETNRELGVHLSMNRGIIIDVLYMIILLVLGTYKFIKKDIKG